MENTTAEQTPSSENTNEDLSQIGSLSLDLQGHILASSGDLQDDQKTAATLYLMLQDTNAIIKASGKTDYFKRLIVSFPNFSFLVTIIGTTVHVLKKKNSTSKN